MARGCGWRTTPELKAASITAWSAKGHHCPVFRSNEPQHTRPLPKWLPPVTFGVLSFRTGRRGPAGEPFGGGAPAI